MTARKILFEELQELARKVFEWNEKNGNQPSNHTPETDCAFCEATNCYCCSIEFDVGHFFIEAV